MNCLKNLSLSIGLWLAGALSLLAQPPPPGQLFPFPKTKAVWTEADNNKYGLQGDTTISSNNYKKIYTSQDSVFDFGNASYFAALREFPEGEIRIVLSGENQERLLYDFNLLQNQTATVWCKDIGMVNITLTGFDSINVVYEQRPIFRVVADGSNNTFEWIGGIGCKAGLFYPAFAGSIGTDRHMVCFSENDSTKYLNALFDDCSDHSVGIKEYPNADVRVYPNPSFGELYIQSTEPLKNAGLEILDLLGRQLYDMPLGNGLMFELNDLGLATGVYAYRLSNNGLIIKTGKLIIR